MFSLNPRRGASIQENGCTSEVKPPYQVNDSIEIWRNDRLFDGLLYEVLSYEQNGRIYGGYSAGRLSRRTV